MNDAELKRLRKRVAYQARAGGRFQATAEIVADLRGSAKFISERTRGRFDDAITKVFEFLANRYEFGEHLKPTPGTEPKRDE